MVVEKPERCEKRCRSKSITLVSWVVRPDGTKGMWLCRKHEMREARAMRNTVIKDQYDKD